MAATPQTLDTRQPQSVRVGNTANHDNLKLPGTTRATERPCEARREPQLRGSFEHLPDPSHRGQRERSGRMRQDHPSVSRGAGKGS